MRPCSPHLRCPLHSRPVSRPTVSHGLWAEGGQNHCLLSKAQTGPVGRSIPGNLPVGQPRGSFLHSRKSPSRSGHTGSERIATYPGVCGQMGTWRRHSRHTVHRVAMPDTQKQGDQTGRSTSAGWGVDRRDQGFFTPPLSLVLGPLWAAGPSRRTAGDQEEARHPSHTMQTGEAGTLKKGVSPRRRGRLFQQLPSLPALCNSPRRQAGTSPSAIHPPLTSGENPPDAPLLEPLGPGLPRHGCRFAEKPLYFAS